MVSATKNHIRALVRGTQQYVVDVKVRSGQLHAECTCPYAMDFGPCKHQWALLRSTDADGSLTTLLTANGVEPTGVHPGVDPDGDDEPFSDPMDDMDIDEDDVEDFNDDGDGTAVFPRTAQFSPPAPPPIPKWHRAIESVRLQMQYSATIDPPTRSTDWPAGKRLVYIVDLDATMQSSGIVIDVCTEKRTGDETWGEPKKFGYDAAVWYNAPDEVDRQIAEMLTGAVQPTAYGNRYDSVHGKVRTSGLVVATRAWTTTLRMICNTGRCRTRSRHEKFNHRTLGIDDGPPWRFVLRVIRGDNGEHSLTGAFVRPDEEMHLTTPWLVHSNGVLFANDQIARFEHGGTFPLVAELRGSPLLPIGADPADVLERLYALPKLPAIELPDNTVIVESHADPVPVFTLGRDTSPWRFNGPMATVKLAFRYGALQVDHPEDGVRAPATLFDRTTRTVHHRQFDKEAAARAHLLTNGVREEWNYSTRAKSLLLSRSKVAKLALQLAREQWHVRVDGLHYRAPGSISASVRSGIDWFDLEGTVSYGDVDVPIAALLDARRRGIEVIEVGEGTMGLMPTEWLDRLGPLAGTGQTLNDVTRFRTSQVALLDAMLATLPDADIDETFAHARQELAGFQQVAPADAPGTFTGILREYQREGLGWLHFLRRFNLGGCLADDMGLGKTIQVLALLEARREDQQGPSLVVVPRSLVFNWIREAQRFTPALRVLDFSGTTRDVTSIDAALVDLVIMTYGTLRQDAARLSEITFDYVILDEAQAIKNTTTATAKASRLLRAHHRLALSGTPIENRIEELWSLLEFLNPGMLGASAGFSALARFATPEARVAEHGATDTDGRTLLAQALRPVILRRRKDDVAKDLPARVEQTLEVELAPKQRKYYDNIRKQYQRSVLERVDRDGIKKSRMHILEALLRLRQAACHPALVDATKKALPSAKLDALIPAIQEVVAEEHKVLVFSQFTQFLSLARKQLDAEGIPYEYLDGKTRDRETRVLRFQSDPGCPVFLISLKAGGHGLNLTAADYVFLLDPWWNPAVEAQAIDRAHRIGQRRRVIATRLVARDTIEAKILQLQESKRALADAILSADQGALSSIGREELELLLG